jgi:hypothetical protein
LRLSSRVRQTDQRDIHAPINRRLTGADFARLHPRMGSGCVWAVRKPVITRMRIWGHCAFHPASTGPLLCHVLVAPGFLRRPWRQTVRSALYPAIIRSEGPNSAGQPRSERGRDLGCGSSEVAYRQALFQLGAELQDDSRPPEVTSLDRTIARWSDQIVAWHRAFVSQRPTEAINNLIKRIKRSASASDASLTTGSASGCTPVVPTRSCSKRSLPAKTRSTAKTSDSAHTYPRTQSRQSARRLSAYPPVKPRRRVIVKRVIACDHQRRFNHVR